MFQLDPSCAQALLSTDYILPAVTITRRPSLEAGKAAVVNGFLMVAQVVSCLEGLGPEAVARLVDMQHRDRISLPLVC